jgi:hypothetical protein
MTRTYMEIMRKRARLNLVRLSVLLATIMLALPSPAAAATIRTFENAKLTTGSLAGVAFPFSFGYDSNDVHGTGQEFIFLTAFDFTLLGTPYTRADISQGGQAIFQDGVLQNVTAAFFNIPPPRTPPVFSIAFGFGGPGVIGYRDLNFEFGEGTYAPANVPEPSSLLTLGLGLALLVIGVRRV